MILDQQKKTQFFQRINNISKSFLQTYDLKIDLFYQNWFALAADHIIAPTPQYKELYIR